MDMSKCERCTERCPQAEMAREIAKGRYHATRDLAKCAPYWDILFDENGNQRITPDYLRDLLQAEEDGKLVNLPGDTVYDRFGMEWTVTTSEIHKFDDGTLHYLYRCGHPGTDDYRALYADEILTREEAAALKKEAEGR